MYCNFHWTMFLLKLDEIYIYIILSGVLKFTLDWKIGRGSVFLEFHRSMVTSTLLKDVFMEKNSDEICKLAHDIRR